MEDKTITNTPIDPNPEELYCSLKRDYQSLQTETDGLRTRGARLEEELEGFRLRESQLREQLEAFRVRETQLQEEIVALRTREAGMKEELEKFRACKTQMKEELEKFRACETQLKEELEKFRAHESLLKEEVIKSQNRAEMIEGYNELMIQMLSKRKEWLLVIDVSTKEIMYCNKKKQEERVDSAFCSACKKRLPFHSEIVKWDSEEQYKVWEMAGEADTYYRITSFPIEWRERDSYVHIIVDITDEKRAAHNLASKAYHDPGTGIKNRLFFEEYMEMVLREEQDTTLCYLDLDGLKYVNDKYGHLEGDIYIQNFVELIKTNFRSEDTFARIGGDEFCLVLSGSIGELIERKMAEILRDFQTGDYAEYQCSFSYGVVNIEGSENHMSYDEILQKADEIMYECKRRNKEKYPQLVR
ncbi:MAG: diguanylate cyclase [Ruminococcus sp.]|nr:diguanylate cyclase [Ruminococcus sp.]